MLIRFLRSLSPIDKFHFSTSSFPSSSTTKPTSPPPSSSTTTPLHSRIVLRKSLLSPRPCDRLTPVAEILSLSFAQTLPLQLPPDRYAAFQGVPERDMPSCADCAPTDGAKLKVIMTTRGCVHRRSQWRRFSAYPLAIDAVLCTRCQQFSYPLRAPLSALDEKLDYALEAVQAGDLREAEFWLRRACNQFPSSLRPQASLGLLYTERAIQLNAKGTIQVEKHHEHKHQFRNTKNENDNDDNDENDENEKDNDENENDENDVNDENKLDTQDQLNLFHGFAAFHLQQAVHLFDLLESPDEGALAIMPNVYKNLANALIQLKQVDRAVDAVERYLAYFQPRGLLDDAELARMRSFVQLNRARGLCNRARALVQDIVHLPGNPSGAPPAHKSGQQCAEDLREAMALAREAQRLDPGLQEPLMILGKCNQRIGDVDMAYKYFKKGHERADPPDVHFGFELCLTACQKGLWRDAVHVGEQLHALADQHPDLRPAILSTFAMALLLDDQLGAAESLVAPIRHTYPDEQAIPLNIRNVLMSIHNVRTHQLSIQQLRDWAKGLHA